MKRLIGKDVGSYTFNAATGVITISGVTLTQNQILIASDTTAGVMLYQFNSAAYGGVWNGIAGTLTLTASTAGLSNSDSLLIYVDVPNVTSLVSDVSAETSLSTLAGCVTSSVLAVSANILNSAQATYRDPILTQGENSPQSITLTGSLRTKDRSTSVVGDGIITGVRYNQIEINFSQAFNATLITNTTDGTYGSAVQANGCATYSTGAAAGGYARGISVQQLSYRPGHEWYCLFTAAFTAGAAGSHQRIGPYNSTDGFWIGYEGTSFGVTQYQNSALVGGTANSAPSVARASFNGDPCNGTTSSAFTSGGTPVALNLAKINVYRIHGAWFGTAAVVLEVFSPDGEWIVLHTFRFPNTLTLPYAYSTNWNIEVDVTNTTNATNLALVTPCLGMGTTDTTLPINTTVTDQTLAQFTRTVITGKTPSGSYQNVLTDGNGNLITTAPSSVNNSLASWSSATSLNATAVAINNTTEYNTIVCGISCNAGTFNTGVITFQGSTDGTNWLSITGVQPNGTTSSTIILASGAYTAYQFNITGFSYFRLLLSTAITGTGVVTLEYSATAYPSNAAVSVNGSVTLSNMPGAISPGTSGGAGSMLYVGGKATTAAPSYGNNTSEPLSLDGSGNLRVNVGAASYVPAAINSTGQVSVTSSGVTIIAANTSRQAVVITNTSSTVTAYIGASGVATTTGYPLAPGASITLPTTAAIYGIVSSTAATVGYLELD
jgi:hypothetical protein